MSHPDVGPAAEAGVIHDIGFRHYTGPRLGRWYLLRSLYVESLRGAYGLGRSGKSKVMPILLLAVVVLPALFIVVLSAAFGSDELPVAYTSYTTDLAFAVTIFVASQSPALVSRDLRFSVMPLYFSRPLTRSDYVLAKFSAMVSALYLLLATPLIILYVGALLVELPFWEQTRGVLAGLTGAALFALVLAGLGLLIASVTPRRGFGVAAVITVLLLLGVVSVSGQAIALANDAETLAGYLGVIDPVALVDGVQVWALGAEGASLAEPPGDLGGAIFGLLTGLLIASCYLLLLLRYRKVSAS